MSTLALFKVFRPKFGATRVESEDLENSFEILRLSLNLSHDNIVLLKVFRMRPMWKSKFRFVCIDSAHYI